MKSFLEIFFVTAVSHECIRYCKRHIDISKDDRNPDDIVYEAATLSSDFAPKIGKDQFVSHSTSWRYERDGSIYLTYLVYSEYLNFGEYKSNILSINDMEMSQSASATKPRPENLKEKHVVWHGMRHLSHLVENSPGGIFHTTIGSKSQLLFSKILPALAMKIN
jgi:hypothetical protein